MKKNQVNSILINQAKRRSKVLAYIYVIIIVFALMCASFIMYTNFNKAQYVQYDEGSDIKYHVYYKDNEFFDEEYLSSNKQYIASLIENIKANFNYKIALDKENVDYKYNYRIEANVIVRDKDTKNLFYDKSEELLETISKETSNSEVSIDETLTIDYNSYNNKIKRLVSVYDLENSESFLNVNMYVNILGTCEDFEDNQEKEKVITLSIPLTEETMAIDFVDNTVNTVNNLMKCEDNAFSQYFFLIVGIALAITGVVLVIYIVRFELTTRTAETIYEKEMKKILNNYGSSIQMLGNDFDFDGYKLLKIDTFSDIIEISDKLSQPVLMKENKEKTGAYFIIPSNTNLLYVYRLKVSDIQKEMDEKIEEKLNI